MIKVRHILLLLFALSAVYFLAELNYARFNHMAGDSAGYVDLIKRVALHGDMRSHVFAAAYPLFDLAKEAKTFCSNALINKYENNSFSQWHAYGIVFPIAWIGKQFTQNYAYIAAILNAISVVFIFIGVYFIALKNKLSWIETLFFILIILSFSPLVGAISGQYYFDRLFIPTAIFYCYLYLQRNSRYCWFLAPVIILFAVLVSERSALMIGLLALYLSVWNTSNNPRYRYTTMIAGVLAVLYYIFWAKFIQDSIYASSTSLSIIFYNLGQIFDFKSTMSKLTVEMLLMLLPLIVLTLPSLKYLILVFIFLAPNILLSVGGAEKNGYVTHYHSYYIPLIIVGAMMGYLEYKKILRMHRFRYFLLAMILAANIVNISGRLFVSSPTLSHSLSGDFRLLFSGSDARKAADSRLKQFDQLLSKININNPTISSNEFTMPILVQKGYSNIRMFPIGLYDSDYLLLESAVEDDPSNLILPIYGDAKELKEISNCTFFKLKDRYTEVGVEDIGAIKYRLMRRTNLK